MLSTQGNTATATATADATHSSRTSRGAGGGNMTSQLQRHERSSSSSSVLSQASLEVQSINGHVTSESSNDGADANDDVVTSHDRAPGSSDAHAASAMTSTPVMNGTADGDTKIPGES